jgi:Ca2+-binding EF-hand superfamily protein
MKHILLTTTLTLAASISFAGEKPGQHFIENWDLDGDGKVTLEEAAERRGDIFASFDADEDGYLASAEYDTFDEARKNDMKDNVKHKKGGMKRVMIGLTRDFNDVDQDGRVSLEEFTGQTQAWISGIDLDGNGAISHDDFKKGH